MSTKMRHVLSLALVTVLAVTMAACGLSETKEGTAVETRGSGTGENTQGTTVSAPEPLELNLYTHYTTEAEKARVDNSIKALESKYPEIRLTFTPIPSDNGEKIKTMAATGQLPDIVACDEGTINLFKKNNLIIPLEKYMKETGVYEKFKEGVIQMMSNVDGHIYAVAKDPQELCIIYYNKSMFEANGIKVPTNYDEFLSAVKGFKSKNIMPIGLFAKQAWPAFSFFDGLVVTSGEVGGLKKIDKGVANITEPAYREAANKFVELVQAGLISKSLYTMAYEEAVALFETEKTPMLECGNWLLKEVGDKMGDKVGIFYHDVLARSGEESKYKGNLVGGGFGSGFAVSANTKDVDRVAGYAVELAYEGVKDSIISSGNVNSALVEELSPSTPFNAMQQQYADDLKNMKSSTSWLWGMVDPKISTALGDNIAKLGAGGYSVDQFIADSDKAIQEARSASN